jgi:hypothetical protein
VYLGIMQKRPVPGPQPPPAIQILLAEDVPTDPDRLKKRFSKSSLIRDLHKQALWSLENYTYYSATGDEFAAVPAASLDPLSRIESCLHPQCINTSVADLARTLGVYADVVVLPDNVTPLVGAYGHRALLEEDALLLFRMAFSLHLLRPLIDSGVVRFFFGEQVMCRAHLAVFDKGVEQIAKRMAKDIMPKVAVEKTAYGFDITNPELFAPLRGFSFYSKTKEAYTRLQKPPQLRRRALQGLSEQLRFRLRETALEMYSASNVGAAYVLDSPLIAAALTDDEIAAVRPEPPRADELASLRLPWVADLSIPEVLELRQSAQPALRRLRALLRKALDASTSNTAIISELRDQAAEVETQLAALPVARNRQFRNATAGLGLTLSLAAVVTGSSPEAAVGAAGSLLSLLALLHGNESTTSHDVARLRAQPAYVLLRAKELVEHRSHG